jgi:radical SAM protein with 4Fe4S-binding SPASM domain
MSVLQWHITERCNFRCKHCYQEGRHIGKDPSYDQLILVLNQFSEFVDNQQQNNKHQVRITGGEPMLHKDWKKLAAEIKKRDFIWSLMTNGTLITPEEASNIADLDPYYVQVSIDGSKDVHDSIRGEGNLDLVLEGVKNLRVHDISVMVSFTAHLANMNEIPKVAQICRENDVQSFWTDRFIPHGEGAKLGSIGPSDIQHYLDLIQTEKNGDGPTKILMHRALQFLEGGTPYKCGAGGVLLTVLHNGTVMTCRRLSGVIGNVYKNTLKEIHLNSPLCKKLRDPGYVNLKCRSCAHFNKCEGGLKCLALVISGDPFSGDPACPLLKENRTNI